MDGMAEGREGRWRTELECIACRRSHDHDKGHGPFQEIGPERRAEGPRRHPKVGEREYALPVCHPMFSFHSYTNERR